MLIHTRERGGGGGGGGGGGFNVELSACSQKTPLPGFLVTVHCAPHRCDERVGHPPEPALAPRVDGAEFHEESADDVAAAHRQSLAIRSLLDCSWYSSRYAGEIIASKVVVSGTKQLKVRQWRRMRRVCTSALVHQEQTVSVTCKGGSIGQAMGRMRQVCTGVPLH